MLEKLSKKDIQELIGPSLFEEVTDFLEELLDDPEEVVNINQKSGQIKLLLSLGNNKITKFNFWKDLYQKHSDREKQNLQDHKINPLDNNTDFVESCLQYCCEKYGVQYERNCDEKSLRSPITICNAPKKPFKILKDFQQEIFKKISKHLEIPRSRFIVQMPTGSGKTRTAMEAICFQFNAVNNKNIIWLAHSKELIEQAANGFEEVWEHIGTYDVELRLVDGDHDGLKDFCNEKPALIISTLQSMRTYLDDDIEKFEFISQSCSLLVIDEAHMSLAKTYKELIKKIVDGGCLLMGLTATPGRDASDEINNKLLAELYFETPVRLVAPDETNVFEYLRNIGVMARTKMTLIHGTEDELTDAELRSFEEKLAIPSSVLNRLAKKEQRNVEIICKLLQILEEKPESKILLFACSVEHSMFLTSILKYKGVKAAHIDGKTSSKSRKAIINDFSLGNINVLSNYGVLATGFDAPKTDVVFIARPTASIVLYSQIIGRGLRGPSIGGTPECLIVNISDNIEGLPEYSKIFDYFDDYYID